MTVTKERKVEIVKEYGRSETDTGKTEVQIALLSERIANLTEHLKQEKKDHSTRRGLLKLVGQRRKMLNYLQKKDLDAYRQLIQRLNLRK
jgi:small subunit ribosomal protein S15